MTYNIKDMNACFVENKKGHVISLKYILVITLISEQFFIHHNDLLRPNPEELHC